MHSVYEAFDELLRRIELNPTRVELASQRYNSIKNTIEGTLRGTTVRQIGSFQRRTKIRPGAGSEALDVDAVVSFGGFHHYAVPGTSGVTPSAAMEVVRRSLQTNDVYRVMNPLQDAPTVQLQYADEMAIELVPAYEDLTGAHSHPLGPNCYIVGATPFTWVPADYDYDARAISSLNAVTGGRLIPAIKIAKAYLRNTNVPLKSFHIEILVANAVPGLIGEWDGKRYEFGYQHILAGFLTRASTTVTTPALLQGSFSRPVDSGMSTATLAVLATFLSERAAAAWRLCSMDSTKAWRPFFGEPFPDE